MKERAAHKNFDKSKNVLNIKGSEGRSGYRLRELRREEDFIREYRWYKRARKGENIWRDAIGGKTS